MILLTKTNEELKDYKISQEARKPGSIWQLLDGIKDSSLKDDGLLEIFYELIGEKLRSGQPYCCLVYFGQYDVPVKGSNREWMEGSEEVYTYLLCTISPLEGEYEPGEPEFGFLYLAFRERTTNNEYINIFEAKLGKFRGLKVWLLS